MFLAAFAHKMKERKRERKKEKERERKKERERERKNERERERREGKKEKERGKKNDSTLVHGFKFPRNYSSLTHTKAVRKQAMCA